MRKIVSTFSPINLEFKKDKTKDRDWAKPVTLDDILKSKLVNTYDELVKDIAQFLFRNRNYTLYYRGQSSDHKDSEVNTTILPSIYRKKKIESRIMLKERFSELNNKVIGLRKLFKESAIKYAGTIMLNKYPEIYG